MAYSLKASGIATDLVMCVAVDSDGTTIKEFVSSDVDTNKTIDSGVTTGSATWKGVSRGYFTVVDNTFDYKGVRFAVNHRPILDAGSPNAFSFFVAFSGGATDPSGSNDIIEFGSSGNSLCSRN